MGLLKMPDEIRPAYLYIKNEVFVRKIIFLVLLFTISIDLFPQNIENHNVQIADQNELFKNSDQNILAKVGDKVITVDEFYRRAEYTIRPNYCKTFNNIDKKIILNSLIAEKLLAMETDENSAIYTNKRIKNFYKGRKEQVMRQLLMQQEGYDKVKLDSSELNQQFELSQYKYKLKFYSVNSDSAAAFIRAEITKNDTAFEEVFKLISNGKEEVPTREIEYFAPENKLIKKALFSRKLEKNEIIGPLRVSDDQYLFMKVDGWNKRVLMSDKLIKERFEVVKNKLTQKYAVKEYASFAAEVMEGKSIQFEPKTLFKLAEILGPSYIGGKKKNKDKFLEMTFEKKNENKEDNNIEDLNEISLWPLFSVDGEVWTVQRLEEYLDVHPFVFRKRKMKKSEFAQQLKLAIVDMIRDKYLTDIAYDRSLDKDARVISNVQMWKDANASIFNKNNYLRSLNLPEDIKAYKVIDDYLKPYIDKLQEKYSDKIEVDVDEFNKIKLSRTDMFVIQRNVPYPVLVPAFPQLTTDHQLDYGNKMENN